VPIADYGQELIAQHCDHDVENDSIKLALTVTVTQLNCATVTVPWACFPIISINKLTFRSHCQLTTEKWSFHLVSSNLKDRFQKKGYLILHCQQSSVENEHAMF